MFFKNNHIYNAIGLNLAYLILIFLNIMRKIKA